MPRRNSAQDEAELTNRVAGLLHDKIDRVSDQAAGLERSMKATARVGTKKVRAARGTLRHEVTRTVDRAARLLKQRPVMGAAIVAAVGLFALSALRR